VGIGASAGGLEAIENFFTHMPAKSGLAFIVIQHLSPDYKILMKELLSKKTSMPVHRAEDGMEVVADAVYLIPPKKTLPFFTGGSFFQIRMQSGELICPLTYFCDPWPKIRAEMRLPLFFQAPEVMVPGV
jgi:two-component system CheB/CheR fusion protein